MRTPTWTEQTHAWCVTCETMTFFPVACAICRSFYCESHRVVCDGCTETVCLEHATDGRCERCSAEVSNV